MGVYLSVCVLPCVLHVSLCDPHSLYLLSCFFSLSSYSIPFALAPSVPFNIFHPILQDPIAVNTCIVISDSFARLQRETRDQRKGDIKLLLLSLSLFFIVNSFDIFLVIIVIILIRDPILNHYWHHFYYYHYQLYYHYHYRHWLLPGPMEIQTKIKCM